MANNFTRDYERGESPFELQDFQHSKPWQWEEDGMTVTRTTVWTAPGCHEGCGVYVYTDKDGNFIKVEGDPESPFNQGRLCPRCFCVGDVMNHKDRVIYPMKRPREERGNPDAWERISWDKALELCASELMRISNTYGGETIHVQRGTGRDIFWQAGRLAYSMNCPNEYGAMSGQSCYCPRISMMVMTMGGQLLADMSAHLVGRYDDPAYDVPNCTVIWGCDPIKSNPDFQMGHWVTECMKRGTKIVTVDPRISWFAARSEVHLALRPGTDGALALAMGNVMVEEDLYDHEFVEKWCHGFDALCERLREWTPERAAEVCWVKADDIRRAARLIAERKPANCFWGVAVDMQNNGIGAAQAIQTLFVLTGNIDIPGGMLFTRPPFGITKNMGGGWGMSDLPEELQQKRTGWQEYPMYRYGFTASSPDIALRDAEAGKLKGLVIQTTNTLTGMGDEPLRWYKVMKDVEFCVGIDIFQTPTTQACCDVFLPAACWPEKQSFRASYYDCSTINPAVKPRGEVKSDAEIGRLLGKMCNEDFWPWDTEEEIYDECLKDTGFTWKQLRDFGPAYPTFEYRKYEKGMMRPDGQPGFMTPTGKIELYSTLLEGFGLDPLPNFNEPMLGPVATPDLYEEYPVILMTGARSPVFFHTEHRQIPHLRQFEKDPYVELNPDFAADHGINDGDWVWLENPRGKCRQRAKLTYACDYTMALARHGWWFPEKEGTAEAGEPSLYGMWDVNVNHLLLNAPSKAGFGSDIKCVLCKVYKVKEGEM
ncbi:MAG: molybdopterin-dependent oxidoreductase [Eggerthellaceae bacterium]|nr:molybdopterin-dependent oxidoreductase [Eggerthellaceae bacterium]